MTRGDKLSSYLLHSNSGSCNKSRQSLAVHPSEGMGQVNAFLPLVRFPAPEIGVWLMSTLNIYHASVWPLLHPCDCCRLIILGILITGQQLLLVKEPENIHDGNAIAVRALDGTEIGYVPSADTHLFVHDVTLAYVVSTGMTTGGRWGVTVRLSSLHPCLLPVSDGHCCNSTGSLSHNCLHIYTDDSDTSLVCRCLRPSSRCTGYLSYHEHIVSCTQHQVRGSTAPFFFICRFLVPNPHQQTHNVDGFCL